MKRFIFLILLLMDTMLSFAQKPVQDTFFGCKFGYALFDWCYIDNSIPDKVDWYDQQTLYMESVYWGGIRWDYVFFHFGSNDRLFRVTFFSKNINLYNTILKALSSSYPMDVAIGDNNLESINGNAIKREKLMVYKNGNRDVKLQINRSENGTAVIILEYTDLALQEKQRISNQNQW